MNKELLEYEIKRKGYTISQFCGVIGMPTSTFYKKCNPNCSSDFTRKEMMDIATSLELESLSPIFFDDKVS